MKKATLLFSVLFSIAALSCEKEGPVGPQGPSGPSGLTIFTVDTFNISSNQWFEATDHHWELDYNTPSLTKDVVDNGVIIVYSKIPPIYPDWFGWPDVVAGEGHQGYRFSYNLNRLTLLGDNFNNPPPNQTIKLVIMR